ncbi:MAG: hypothetical protein SGI88_15655 [Candidatus Hydrogenedentes bacterium]|nr:hypothetical protein [Candidatus Hydrogenedentota bacterium]
MVTHASCRQQISHRTHTTAQRLGHRSRAESQLDWGAISKMVLGSTIMIGVVFWLVF